MIILQMNFIVVCRYFNAFGSDLYNFIDKKWILNAFGKLIGNENKYNNYSELLFRIKLHQIKMIL